MVSNRREGVTCFPSSSIAVNRGLFDRISLFLPRFVYNANVQIDAAHRSTFIVENQLRVILTVYLTVNVIFCRCTRRQFKYLQL